MIFGRVVDIRHGSEMVKFQIFSTKIRTSTERGKSLELFYSPGKLVFKMPF